MPPMKTVTTRKPAYQAREIVIISSIMMVLDAVLGCRVLVPDKL